MTATNPVRLFVSGLLSFGVCGMVPSLYGVAIPFYARTFDLTEAAAGIILSANAAGAFLAVMAGIFAVPGLTGRSSFGFLAAGSIAAALAPTWGMIIAGIFLLGIGFGTSAAVFNRRFMAEFGVKGPAMIGLLNATWALGAIAAPIVFVAVSAEPKLVLLGMGILSLAMIPVVQPSGNRPERLKISMPPARSIILVVASLSVMVEVSLMGYGPARLIAGGMEEASAAKHLSGFFVAFFLGRIGMSMVANIVPPKWLFVGAQLTVAALCLLAISGQPSIAVILLGAPVGICFPAIFVWLSGVLGPDPRAANGIVASSLGGAIIGPAILGGLLGQFGMLSLFHLTAVLALLAAGLAAFLGAAFRQSALDA